MRLGTRRGRLRGGRLVPRPACADRFLSVSKRPAGGHEVELDLLPSDESADEWELYRNGEKFGRVKFPPAGEAQVEFDGKQLRLDAVDKLDWAPPQWGPIDDIATAGAAGSGTPSSAAIATAPAPAPATDRWPSTATQVGPAGARLPPRSNTPLSYGRVIATPSRSNSSTASAVTPHAIQADRSTAKARSCAISSLGAESAKCTENPRSRSLNPTSVTDNCCSTPLVRPMATSRRSSRYRPVLASTRHRVVSCSRGGLMVSDSIGGGSRGSRGSSSTRASYRCVSSPTRTWIASAWRRAQAIASVK